MRSCWRYFVRYTKNEKVTPESWRPAVLEATRADARQRGSDGNAAPARALATEILEGDNKPSMACCGSMLPRRASAWSALALRLSGHWPAV